MGKKWIFLWGHGTEAILCLWEFKGKYIHPLSFHVVTSSPCETYAPLSKETVHRLQGRILHYAAIWTFFNCCMYGDENDTSCFLGFNREHTSHSEMK